MKSFIQHIDRRHRQAMTDYLRGHPRYDTMNSWNRSTSYAHGVKLHDLELTPEQLAVAWDLLDCEEVFDAIQALLQEWAIGHQWRWQVGFNGRSNGYLVLYQGGLDHEHARTARCDACGKLTWHKQDVPCTREGCDGALRVLEKPRPRIITYPGRSLDQGEDFADWDIESLRDRVRLIQSFDRLCQDVLELFCHTCDHYTVIDRQILVPKTVKVLEPV